MVILNAVLGYDDEPLVTYVARKKKLKRIKSIGTERRFNCTVL